MVCGVDLCYNMEFIFEEVVCGVIKEICILILEECDVCYGSGVKSGI